MRPQKEKLRGEGFVVLDNNVDVTPQTLDARFQYQSNQLAKALLLTFFGVLLAVGVAIFWPHPGYLRLPDDWIFLVAVTIAPVAFVGAGFYFYDSRSIPNELLRAPSPFELITDQPWRKPTRLRFLERLKDDLTQAENRIQHTHKSALQAYEHLPKVVSYSDYRRSKAKLKSNEQEKRSLLQSWPQFQERIDQIFSGNVGKEILSINEAIKKMQRANAERQREISDQKHTDERCSISNCAYCKEWERRRKPQLYSEIYHTDQRIIELETDLEELKNFDFQQLWSDLHLPGPPNLTRVPKEALDDLQAKVNTLNAIPPLNARQPAAAAPPKLSREEQCRQKQAEIEATRARYRKEKAEKVAAEPTVPGKRRWENFYDDAERELDDELKKWLR